MPSKMLRLQDELASVYKQLKEAISKNEQLNLSRDSYIRKLEEKLKDKQNEINILNEKVKSNDPKKIQQTVLEEATTHYESRIKELHEEADQVREQYNNLNCDYALLKCTLESRESEFSHTIERLKLQHLGEIEQLQNKIESLEKENSLSPDTYAVELKSAKREIVQLDSKLKALLSECEELRAQNENLTVQINSLNRMLSKQAADNKNNIRTLESEKLSVTMQKEALEKELLNCHEHRKNLNNELQASKHEIFVLKSKIEECEYKCHMTVTNLQVEAERLKSEQETEQDQLMEEISKLKSDLRSATSDLSHAHQIIQVKEQEFQQSLLATRQQIWKQSNELNQERDKIERKFKDLEISKDQIISQLQQELHVVKQNLHICSESKISLEKEFVEMRKKFEEAIKITNSGEYENLLMQNSRFKKEIHDLREKIEFLTSRINEYQEQERKFMKDSTSFSKTKNYGESDNEVLQLKLSWEQQKLQYNQRLDELESQLKEAKNSAAAEKREQEFKIKNYSQLTDKLKNKLEHLKAQKEILEKNVPYEEYLKVKHELKEISTRLKEFQLLVSSEPDGSLSNIALSMFTDKPLTDIQNIKLPTFSLGNTSGKEEPLKLLKDTGEVLIQKKNIHPRRRSVKARDRAHQMLKIASPVISSSSDLDLENL